MKRKLYLYFLSIIIRILSFFFKKKDILIFYGNHQFYHFEGNLKYLFSDCLNNKLKYKIFYLCLNKELFNDINKKGYPAIFWQDKNFSVSDLMILLKAKYVIADYDFAKLETSVLAYTLLEKATRIQLWHTRPTVKKPISEKLDNKNFFKKGSLDYSRQIHRKSFSYLISPLNEEEIENLTYRGFKFKEIYKCKSLKIQFLKKKNYTALDLINTPDFLIKDKMPNIKKVLLLPTANFKNYNLKKEDNFSLINDLNFDEIDQKIINQNIKLFVKLHRLDQKQNYKEYKNIIFIPAYSDIYTNLNFFDYFLTDFSSICYDLLQLKKPIILCCKKISKKNYTQNFIKVYESLNLVQKEDSLYEFLKNPDMYLNKNNFDISKIDSLNNQINNSIEKDAKDCLCEILK